VVRGGGMEHGSKVGRGGAGAHARPISGAGRPGYSGALAGPDQVRTQRSRFTRRISAPQWAQRPK